MVNIRSDRDIRQPIEVGIYNSLGENTQVLNAKLYLGAYHHGYLFEDYIHMNDILKTPESFSLVLKNMGENIGSLIREHRDNPWSRVRRGVEDQLQGRVYDGEYSGVRTRRGRSIWYVEYPMEENVDRIVDMIMASL